MSEIDVYAGWRSGLAEGAVRVTACSSCAAVHWYPLVRCPECGAEEWVWLPVSAAGRIHSWCRVHRPTVPVDGLEPPYVLALIEPEDHPGVRVIGVAEDAGTDPVVGGRARLTVRSVGEHPRPHFTLVD